MAGRALLRPNLLKRARSRARASALDPPSKSCLLFDSQLNRAGNPLMRHYCRVLRLPRIISLKYIDMATSSWPTSTPNHPPPHLCYVQTRLSQSLRALNSDFWQICCSRRETFVMIFGKLLETKSYSILIFLCGGGGKFLLRDSTIFIIYWWFEPFFSLSSLFFETMKFNF